MIDLCFCPCFGDSQQSVIVNSITLDLGGCQGGIPTNSKNYSNKEIDVKPETQNDATTPGNSYFWSRFCHRKENNVDVLQCQPCKYPSCLKTVKRAKSCCSVVFSDKLTQPGKCGLCNVIDKAKAFKELKDSARREHVGTSTKITKAYSSESFMEAKSNVPNCRCKMRKEGREKKSLQREKSMEDYSKVSEKDYSKDEPVRECRRPERDKSKENNKNTLNRKSSKTSNKDSPTKEASKISYNDNDVCTCGGSKVYSSESGREDLSSKKARKHHGKVISRDSSRESYDHGSTSAKSKDQSKDKGRKNKSDKPRPRRGRSRESCIKTCSGCKHLRDSGRGTDKIKGKRGETSGQRAQSKDGKKSNRRNNSREIDSKMSLASSPGRRNRRGDIHKPVRSRSSSNKSLYLRPNLSSTNASAESRTKHIKSKVSEKNKRGKETEKEREKEKRALLDQMYSSHPCEDTRPYVTKFSCDKIINERLILLPALVKEKRRIHKEKKPKTPKSKVESQANNKGKKTKIKQKVSTRPKSPYDIIFPNPFDNLTRNIVKPSHFITEKRKPKSSFLNDPLYASRKSTPKHYTKTIEVQDTVIDCQCPVPYRSLRYNLKESSKVRNSLLQKDKLHEKATKSEKGQTFISPGHCKCKNCDCKICCIKDYKAQLRVDDFECQCSCIVKEIDVVKSLPSLTKKCENRSVTTDTKHSMERDVASAQSKITRKRVDNCTCISSQFAKINDKSLTHIQDSKKASTDSGKYVDRNIMCVCEALQSSERPINAVTQDWLVNNGIKNRSVRKATDLEESWLVGKNPRRKKLKDQETCISQTKPKPEKLLNGEKKTKEDKSSKGDMLHNAEIKIANAVKVQDEQTQKNLLIEETIEVEPFKVEEKDEKEDTKLLTSVSVSGGDAANTIRVSSEQAELDAGEEDTEKVDTGERRSYVPVDPLQRGSLERPIRYFPTKFSNQSFYTYKRREIELGSVEYDDIEATNTNSAWKGNTTFQKKFEYMLKSFLERVKGFAIPTNDYEPSTSADSNAVRIQEIGPDEVEIERLEPSMNIREDLDKELKSQNSMIPYEQTAAYTAVSEVKTCGDIFEQQQPVIEVTEKTKSTNKIKEKMEASRTSMTSLKLEKETIIVEASKEVSPKLSKVISTTKSVEDKTNDTVKTVDEKNGLHIQNDDQVPNEVFKEKSAVIDEVESVKNIEIDKPTNIVNKAIESSVQTELLKENSIKDISVINLEVIKKKSIEVTEQIIDIPERISSGFRATTVGMESVNNIVTEDSTTRASLLNKSKKVSAVIHQEANTIPKEDSVTSKTKSMEGVVNQLVDRITTESVSEDKRGRKTPSWESRDLPMYEDDNSNIETATSMMPGGQGYVTPNEPDEYLVDVVSLSSDSKMFCVKNDYGKSKTSEMTRDGVIRDAIDLRNQSLSANEISVNPQTPEKMSEKDISSSKMLKTLQEAVEKRAAVEQLRETIRDSAEPNVQATETQGSIIEEIGRMNSRDERFMEGTTTRNIDTISIQFPERPETVNQGVATTDRGCGCPNRVQSRGN